jgi:signal transduction histidine kinase
MAYLTLFRPAEVRSLTDTQKALQHFLKLSVQLTQADSGSFMLLNPNTGLLDIEASVGLSKRASQVKLRLGQGVTGWVATTGKILRIEDVRLERKYVSVSPRVRSELAVPVEWKGQVVGIINLDSHTVGHFQQKEEDLLVQLSREAAEWMAYFWEVQKMRVKDQQLTTLVDMGRAIVSQANLDEVLQRITRDAARLMKTPVCSLMMLSADKRELMIRACHGTSPRYAQNRKPISVEESLVGVVINRRRPLSVLNVQVDHRYQQTELARKEGLISLLSVPLIFGVEIIGVLNVYTLEAHRFSNDEIRLLQTLADLSAVAIEKTRLLARVVETEEMLRQSERLSALGLLATEVAHEIRNPLTVMQMLFHSLVNSTLMSAPAQKDAAIIEEKMRHMNRIVDQVLKLARSTEPSKQRLLIDQMLDDITLLIRHKLSQQNVEIRRQIAENLPAVWADRTQLEQAVLNLVLNAVAAMEHGGILWLGAHTEQYQGTTYMALTVRDNGAGMSKLQTEKIFAPFLTTKQHGTGIGLAIVQKIMENHRGKVLVTSKKGRGTKFRLLVPLEEGSMGAN